MYGDCDTYTSHRLNNNNSITTETYFMLLKIYPVQTILTKSDHIKRVSTPKIKLEHKNMNVMKHQTKQISLSVWSAEHLNRLNEWLEKTANHCQM